MSEALRNDSELIEALLDPSARDEAMRELHLRFTGLVRQAIRHYVCEDDRDDVMQLIWLRLFENASQYDEEKARVSTWLVLLARRTAINWWRWHKRRRARLLSSLNGELDRLAREPRTLYDAETRTALESALDDLTDTLLSVVILYHFNDHSEEEVAIVLGIPKGTVKSRLHHATRKLRRALCQTHSTTSGRSFDSSLT